MTWLVEQESCVPAWGLLPCELDWADWRIESIAVFPHLSTPDVAEALRADVFTDGSAVGQGVTGFAVAAASVVHCNGYTTVKQDAMPLPGNDHSAYCAQGWGVLMALSRFRFVHILSDCASVIGNLKAAISARRSRFVPKFSDREDLCGIVWRLLSEREPDAVTTTSENTSRCEKHIGSQTALDGVHEQQCRLVGQEMYPQALGP